MEPTDGASVSNRFDAFLGELDGLTPTTEKQIEKRLRELRNIKRGKPARMPTKKRQQRNRTNKLARPLNPVKKPEAPVVAEPSTTLPPLAPANKEAALEAKKRLASQDAKQASCPDLDSGATCWGLLPDRTACRVPCTLSVVASPPTLVWHSSNEDNKVQRRTWRWGDLNEDGEPGWVGLDRATRRIIERRLCGPQSEVIEDDSYVEARRHRHFTKKPLVVLKCTTAFLSSMHHQAAKRAADAVEKAPPDTSGGQHACAFYTKPKAARAALQALLFTEPAGESVGEAGVVLQRYIPSKGGKPWICRALVDARAAANLQWKLRRGEENTKIDAGPWAHGGGQPEAWVLSESSQEEVATSTARCVEGTCSVVRSVPGSQAWTDAKVCTASILRGLNHVLGNQLTAIACDCVQDERGRWSVLQIKGIRGTFDRSEVWMPRKKIIVRNEEPFQAVECEGAYCDQEIPEDRLHEYQDAMARDLRFSIPRKVVLDKPRGDGPRPTAAALVKMSRRQRLALYDAVKVCAHCHFVYCGPPTQRVLQKPPPTRERVEKTAEMIDEGLTAAAARSPDTDQPPTILADLLNATALPKQDEEAFIGDAKDKEIRDLRRQIAELTKSVPAPPPSAPPKPGPADPNSWIFQLGVSPKKEEEGLGETEPGPDAAAAIRGAEGELDAIFSSAGQFLDDLDIIFEEGERQGYEGEGLAGIRV